MAMTKQEVSYLAAGCVTTQRIDEVAAVYSAWIDTKPTLATAVVALAASMRTSKSPTQVKANADVSYEYLEADPATVTSISPATGAAAGGTAVTINGTNFAEVTSVTIGGVAITSLVHVSDTRITGVTGAHAAGAVSVVAVHPVGNGTLAAAYTYV